MALDSTTVAPSPSQRSASNGSTEERARGRSEQEVLPYGPIVTLAPNLFQVTGSLKFPIPRNMTVVRTDREELVIYSAIAMHEDGMRALEALGRPAVMVIPHRRHQMDAPFYKNRYPSIRVLAANPARVRVSVDGGLSELAEYGIEAYVLPGNTYEDVVMDIPVSPDERAIAVCETLGNVAMSGWLSLAFAVLGPPGGGFGVARAVRWREIRDQAALRRWLEQQADRTDLRALLVGHGAPLTSGISSALRRAASHL